MKIRNGFVSNSSSSSFVCDVSGDILSGWDGDYGIEVFTCKNGHGFQGEYKTELNDEERVSSKRQYILEYKYSSDEEKQKANEFGDEEFEDWFDNDIIYFDDGCPVEWCPICSLSNPTDQMIMQYLLYLTERTREDALSEIRGMYKNYDVFKKNVIDREDDND